MQNNENIKELIAQTAKILNTYISVSQYNIISYNKQQIYDANYNNRISLNSNKRSNTIKL